MLQAVWKKAWENNGLDINFKTKAGAQRARMQLYNAVKRQKAEDAKSDDLEDVILVRAANGLEIIWRGETSLRLQRKDNSDMMQGLSAALDGKTARDFVDEAALPSEKMLEEIMRIQGGANAPTEPAAELPSLSGHVDTPFYPKRG